MLRSEELPQKAHTKARADAHKCSLEHFTHLHTPQVHLVQQQKNRYNKSVMAPFTVVQGWLVHLLAGLDVVVHISLP